MQLCLHIPKDAFEASLYELRSDADGVRSRQPLVERVPLEAALFQPGGGLHRDTALGIFESELTDTVTLQTLGKTLFQAVHVGDLGVALRQLREDFLAAREEWRLLPPNDPRRAVEPDFRLYLDIENEDLRALPWELMYDPAKSRNWFLDPGVLLMRVRAPQLKPNPSAFQWPVRLLLLVGADPRDAGVAAGPEVARIRRELRPFEHLFDLEVIQISDLPAFDQVGMEQRIVDFDPHIVHFIGHSAAATATDEARLLFYHRTLKRYVAWTTASIGTFLRRLDSLRLVYLNACRSQAAAVQRMSGPMLGDVFLEYALAVVAMQGDVLGDPAGRCAAAFYTQFARGQRLDQAMSAARRELLDPGKTFSREPFLPVLICRYLPEEVLRTHCRLPVIEQRTLEERTRDVRRAFVNQQQQRRGILRTLAGTPLEEERAGIVLRGPSSYGKTWLLTWCLYGLAAQGARVHSLEVPLPGDWLEVVRAVRDGGNDILRPGLDPESRSRLNWKLNRWAKGLDPGPFPGGAVSDTLGPLSGFLGQGSRNDLPKLVCQELRTALEAEAEAANRLTVIALDRWRSDQAAFSRADFDLLREHLFEALTTRPDSRVKVILSVSDDAWRTFGGVSFPVTTWSEPPPLDKFSREDLVPLTLELLERLFPGKDLTSTEGYLRMLTPDPKSPAEIRTLCDAIGPLIPS